MTKHIQHSATDKYLQITSHQTEYVNEPLRNGDFVSNPLWVRFEVDMDYFDMDNYQFIWISITFCYQWMIVLVRLVEKSKLI